MRQRIHRPDWGQGTLSFGRQLAGRFYCDSGTVLWMFLFRCRTAVCVIVCFFYLSLICPRFNLWCPFHSKDLIVNTFVYLTIIWNFQHKPAFQHNFEIRWKPLKLNYFFVNKLTKSNEPTHHEFAYAVHRHNSICLSECE